jgi:GDP-4-dehydro-6-deoxy-D-mannose reductase
MRVLVTGATGFVGQHLVGFLRSVGYTVYGTYLSKGPIEHISEEKLFRCDVRDAVKLCAIVRQTRAQRIYHLAAYSSVISSFGDLRNVFETNFWGTFNVLEAVRQAAPKARVLVVGSGQCYGWTRPAQPRLTESLPFSPQSPYALSKAAADMLADHHYQRFGLHVIRARPFNHTGPGQAPQFVCSDLARQIASIELRQRRPILHVGDLTVRRDFSDVRDVVRAYELLLEKGAPGEAYNVASGRGTSVKQIVRVLTSYCSRPIRISVQRRRLRPGETRTLYGSSRKLRAATGWKPRFSLRATLHDLYLYWKVTLQARELPTKSQSLPG